MAFVGVPLVLPLLSLMRILFRKRARLLFLISLVGELPVPDTPTLTPFGGILEHHSDIRHPHRTIKSPRLNSRVGSLSRTQTKTERPNLSNTKHTHVRSPIGNSQLARLKVFPL